MKAQEIAQELQQKEVTQIINTCDKGDNHGTHKYHTRHIQIYKYFINSCQGF